MRSGWTTQLRILNWTSRRTCRSRKYLYRERFRLELPRKQAVMTRTIRRRKKQRIYWVEIGFLVLGLIALRPSLVTDLVAMGQSSDRFVPKREFVGDYRNPAYTDYTNGAGIRSYYPAWNPSTYPTVDPRTAYTNPSSAAWPDPRMHQWVHNGTPAPLVASPTLSNNGWGINPWNNNPWNNNNGYSNPLVPSSDPSRYPTPTPVYTGRY